MENQDITYSKKFFKYFDEIVRHIKDINSNVNLEEDEMLAKFFTVQWKYPTKEDWTIQVQRDLEDFEITKNLEQIKSMSKNVFKKLVKVKAKKYAFNYLLKLKSTHTKMKNITYTELKLQNYLKSDNIPVYEAKNLYQFRVRAANFRENYKNKYESESTVCPLCLNHQDTQAHCVECVDILQMLPVEGNYTDIFGNKIPSNISRTLHKITKYREDKNT